MGLFFMNNFEQFKSSLISLGMAYRNKYAELPDFVILGTQERNLLERFMLSLMKPSEIAAGHVTKEVLGFKIINSTEKTYFAVAKRLLTESEYLSINLDEKTGLDLFQGQNYHAYLNIPLEKIETAKGSLFGIVLHNTQRNPTLDVYSELNQAYDFFNEKLFDGQLPKCLITFQREKQSLGYLATNRFTNREGESLDELAMNPSYFGIRSIADTLSTLVHEQCHKWQTTYGKPSRAGYHNHEFANKMESIGLMASHNGAPGGKRVGQQMDHYIIKGGPFEIACEQLLSTQFSLSWYDRYPPVSHAKISIKDQLKPFIESLAKLENELQLKPILPDIKDPEIEEGDGETEATPKPVVNRSNRAKYRCPSCKAQVWGKPDLLLKCGEEKCENKNYELVED